MSNLNRCSWKLIDPGKFVMGVSADRCGAIADVVILRPNRKTDLFLCEEHINEFIAHWGLYNKVEILCRCEEEEPSCVICGGKENIFIDTGICYCCRNNGRCPHRDSDGNTMNGIDWDDIPASPIHCVDPECKKCVQDDPKTWFHR